MSSSRTFLRTLAATLLVFGCVSLVLAHSRQASDAALTQTSNDSPTPSTPGRQLVHESREAAGEEKDEMEEFKHSGSVRLISRLTGLNLRQSYWLRAGRLAQPVLNPPPPAPLVTGGPA